MAHTIKCPECYTLAEEVIEVSDVPYCIECAVGYVLEHPPKNLIHILLTRSIFNHYSILIWFDDEDQGIDHVLFATHQTYAILAWLQEREAIGPIISVLDMAESALLDKHDL